jgi:hypothetical protein
VHRRGYNCSRCAHHFQIDERGLMTIARGRFGRLPDTQDHPMHSRLARPVFRLRSPYNRCRSRLLSIPWMSIRVKISAILDPSATIGSVALIYDALLCQQMESLPRPSSAHRLRAQIVAFCTLQMWVLASGRESACESASTLRVDFALTRESPPAEARAVSEAGALIRRAKSCGCQSILKNTPAVRRLTAERSMSPRGDIFDACSEIPFVVSIGC